MILKGETDQTLSLGTDNTVKFEMPKSDAIDMRLLMRCAMKVLIFINREGG